MASDRPAASPRPTSSRAGFRDDIQGMRALAVLAIMAFHAGFSPYPGGFVTLDVFFVISGFLITSLLLREIARSGTLSLRRFYERRARRILPAATVATLGIVAASWLWLSLVETEEAVTDARWATLFAANIRFAMEETDYFAESQPPSPFQHYWSLSVEEQFYAVLPLVLLGCILLAARLHRRHARVTKKQTIAIVLGAVTALSFAWSVYASHTSPDTAYFSTLTRTWEFGVGGLLAVVAPRVAARFSTTTRNLLAAGGLGAIVVACFTVTESTPFPGYVALLPVLGTGAVMIAGAEIGDRPLPFAQRALGVGPLRLIGDMSYSLYLWHWPVLTIATLHLGRDLSPRGLVVAFVAIGAVSWASYRYVETPFRRGMPPRLGQGLVLYPLTVVVVIVGTVGVSGLVQYELNRDHPAITLAAYSSTPSGHDLDPDPKVALVQASARAAKEDAPVPGSLRPALDELAGDKAELDGCDYDDEPRELCRRGDPDAKRSMVLLGDSHGRHWIPALEKVARKAGYAAYYLVKPGCTAARVHPVPPDENEADQECVDFNTWVDRQVARLEPDVAVISSTGVGAVEVDGEVVEDSDRVASAVRDGFGEAVRTLQANGAEVSVLADVPRRRSDPANCLSKRGATLGSCDNRERSGPKQVVAATREAAESNGATFVPTRKWFCSDDVCPPVVGSTVTMRDNGHVTTTYAAELTDPIADQLPLGDR